MQTVPANKLRAILGMAAALALGVCAPRLFDALYPDSLLPAAGGYALAPALIILWLRRRGADPLAYLHLHSPRPRHLVGGVVLGVFMAALQQLPLLAMGVDYRQFAAPLQWPGDAFLAIFCLLVVGPCEEILFRGFLLRQTLTLTDNRALAVAAGCLLFWVAHWPPLPFVFGQFFNLSLNTAIWCAVLLRSRRPSLYPLIVSHGVYDIVVSLLLPAALHRFTA